MSDDEKGSQHIAKDEPPTDCDEEQPAEKRPPIRFKKRAEAIPLKESPRRSRSGKSGRGQQSKRSRRSKNFFDDDESISDFRGQFSKPIIAIVGIFWLLGIAYLFKLGFTEAKPVEIASNEAVAIVDSQPVSLQDAYRRLSGQMGEAEDLLEMSHNVDAMARGASLKLKSLFAWNILDMTNDRQDVEMANKIGTDDSAVHWKS